MRHNTGSVAITVIDMDAYGEQQSDGGSNADGGVEPQAAVLRQLVMLLDALHQTVGEVVREGHPFSGLGALLHHLAQGSVVV